MKKLFTVMVVACMAFAMPSQAQTKFGLKGGLNLTSLTSDKSTDGISNQAGFFVGPTVKFTLPVVGLSIDGSALYDQRNAKIKGTDQTIKAQSIQIPINIRYGVGLSSLVNVFAFAGPQFGFNVGDKSKLLDQIGTWSLKSSNISGNVGIGATVFSKLQITANYNFQLSKTGEVEYINADGTTRTGKMKFNSWQLGLGYYF
jgi:opacity protein-like surface antigen